MEALMDEERDPRTPLGVFRTGSRRVRHLLFTKYGEGATFTIASLADEASTTNQNAAQTIAVMRELGFTFAARKETPEEMRARGSTDLRGGMNVFTLANPHHSPSAESLERLRQRPGGSRTRAARVAAADGNGHTPATAPALVAPRKSSTKRAPIPPLPVVGEMVMVWAVAAEEDGTISIAVRNGSHSWVGQVTAQTARKHPEL